MTRHEAIATSRLTVEQRSFLAAHRRDFRDHLAALADPKSRLFCGNGMYQRERRA